MKCSFTPVCFDQKNIAFDVNSGPLSQTMALGNGLFKTEVIRRCGLWRSIDEVEYATLEWVEWFNHCRLLESIGNIPPAELETAYYHQLEESAMAA